MELEVSKVKEQILWSGGCVSENDPGTGMRNES